MWRPGFNKTLGTAQEVALFANFTTLLPSDIRSSEALFKQRKFEEHFSVLV